MISESEIEWAVEQNACEDAIEWLRESPRSINETLARYAVWLLEHASARLTDAQFAFAVSAEPYAALAYEHASNRLSDEQFALAFAAEPWTAFSHEHAFSRFLKGKKL